MTLQWKGKKNTQLKYKVEPHLNSYTRIYATLLVHFGILPNSTCLHMQKGTIQNTKLGTQSLSIFSD